jgi:hypothetical protein
VAWFVSNCKTQSQREEYVEALAKYIPVDVYGECGSFTCGSRHQNNRSYCDKTLLSDPGSYKFYLSFENSLCDGYVTEKLWRLLKEDVLQVVMGAVNYSALLPEQTFLNVADFASPKELSEYLYHLDADDVLYDIYLRRKKSIKMVLDGVDEPYHCRVCRYLHLHNHERQIQKDLVQFWGRGRCHHPAYFYAHSSGDVAYRKK